MNWLDLLILICVAAGLIKGLFVGAIKQVISVVALLAAIFCSGKVAVPLQEYLLNCSSVTQMCSERFIYWGSYILAFVIIIFLFHWLGILLHSAIKMTPVGGLNHLLGGLLGGFKWVIFLSLLFVLLTTFDPNYKIINEQTRQESVLFDKIHAVVPAIYPFIKNQIDWDKIHWNKDILPLPSETEEKKAEV